MHTKSLSHFLSFINKMYLLHLYTHSHLTCKINISWRKGFIQPPPPHTHTQKNTCLQPNIVHRQNHHLWNSSKTLSTWISQCIFHFNFKGFNLHMKFDQVKNYIWNSCDNILPAIHTNFTWKFSLLLLHGFTWISLFEAIFHVYTHDIVSI